MCREVPDTNVYFTKMIKRKSVTFQEILLDTRKELAHKYLVKQRVSAIYVGFVSMTKI